MQREDPGPMETLAKSKGNLRWLMEEGHGKSQLWLGDELLWPGQGTSHQVSLVIFPRKKTDQNPGGPSHR